MVKNVNTAMIMAAGKGTRMMPLTADRPKPLVEVGGVALLDHVLDHLRDAGIGKIVVNAHYLGDQIEAHFAAHATDFDVSISDERELLRDTGGGLVQALPMISDDPFICVNADNWWTNDGQNAISRLIAHWDGCARSTGLRTVNLSKLTTYSSCHHCFLIKKGLFDQLQ
jgi:MurNAc alpha-1-phosphate uridylyltransferase